MIQLRNDVKDNNKYDLANYFNAYLKDGEFVYNLNQTIYITSFDTINPSYYTTYEVRERDTWASISYSQYGTYKLWWLICKVNHVHEPLVTNPVPGDNLKILTSTIVENILRQIGS